MAPLHPCNCCDEQNKCGHRYIRSRCVKLQKLTETFTAEDMDIVKEQFISMLGNHSTPDAAMFFFTILYKDVAANTANLFIEKFVTVAVAHDPNLLEKCKDV